MLPSWQRIRDRGWPCKRSLQQRQRPRRGRAELIVMLLALTAALSTASWVGTRVDVELSRLFDLPSEFGFAHGYSAPHPVVGFQAGDSGNRESSRSPV
jgi:hypothetical protein